MLLKNSSGFIIFISSANVHQDCQVTMFPRTSSEGPSLEMAMRVRCFSRTMPLRIQSLIV
ncbi:hypothetical protein BBX50_25705 [Ensifer sp. LC11]|nr:hypothetical protein BBX50_25705 [Ensifer sp. LC11]